MDGFRIVQISDIHVGPTVGKDFVDRLVDMVNHINGDLIIISGDLIEGDLETYIPIMEPLGNLRAPHGVYYVTGNHEYIRSEIYRKFPFFSLI